MRYKGIVISHKGTIRISNEDNAYLNEYYRKDDNQLCWEYETDCNNNMLAAVFDGISGSSNGVIASRIAAESLAQMVMNDSETEEGMKNVLGIEDGQKNIVSGRFSEKIADYIIETNQKIVEYGKGINMGTTCCILSIEDNEYCFGNIGDSRGYLFRDSVLTQMTKDHNMVSELLKQGILTKKQADRHPDRNALYKYLGMKDEDEEMVLEAYINKAEHSKIKDICLLCTDGLTAMVSDNEIETLLGEEQELAKKGKELLRMALENGGKDNITLLLIEVTE